jgi:L-asparaginase II
MRPWIVEITRGDMVESQHIGHGVVVDQSGQTLLAFGDAARVTFPRSAAKWVQGIELVRSGAADAFQLTDQHLAIACASHNGEKAHTELVSTWLAQIGLQLSDLECGTSAPFTEEVRLQLAHAHATPNPLHHCCSGKHVGMLTVCVHSHWPTAGYTDYGHPLQVQIREHMRHIFACDSDALTYATDGCSVPTYAMPLHTLASGFARLTSDHIDVELREAAIRLFNAQSAQPFMVAGTNRLDTALLQAGEGRLQVKMGAEGVYCGAIPDRGLGFALKCEDGTLRGQEALVIELLGAIGEDMIVERLAPVFRYPQIVTARGHRVGQISVRRE